MRIHDISRPIGRGIPVWPGDTPFDFSFIARIAEGSPVNIGRIEMSVHTGAHTDAPRHFEDGAPDIASVPLEPYLGPAVVARVEPSARGITPADLPDGLEDALREAPRLLLRTYASRPAAFDEHMAHATVELAEWLAARSVVLLGLDSDSMDAFDSKELPAHHRLTAHGISILEGLDLSKVEEGTYELIALPLRIEGADGSPVRAVLVER
jgi:arylformamidase